MVIFSIATGLLYYSSLPPHCIIKSTPLVSITKCVFHTLSRLFRLSRNAHFVRAEPGRKSDIFLSGECASHVPLFGTFLIVRKELDREISSTIKKNPFASTEGSLYFLLLFTLLCFTFQ